jgi:hypothetical protein
LKLQSVRRVSLAVVGILKSAAKFQFKLKTRENCSLGLGCHIRKFKETDWSSVRFFSSPSNDISGCSSTIHDGASPKQQDITAGHPRHLKASQTEHCPPREERRSTHGPVKNRIQRAHLLTIDHRKVAAVVLKSTSTYIDNTNMSSVKFCPDCNNMLYPREDRTERKLFFACRNCEHHEEAQPDSLCIFRHQILHATRWVFSLMRIPYGMHVVLL